jgi:putative transposase
VFDSLVEAREIIERWRHDYNHLRPHSSLGALTPTELAAIEREQTRPPQEGELTDGLYL